MTSLRLIDPVLIVGLNKLGLSIHQAMGEMGFTGVMAWCPNHRRADNKSLIKLFDRHLTKVYWGYDTPDRVFVATIVALDVHPETDWPARFGRIRRVPDFIEEYPHCHHLNNARRIRAGILKADDLGFNDSEMVTLPGIPLRELEDLSRERIEREPELVPPSRDGLFANGRKGRARA